MILVDIENTDGGEYFGDTAYVFQRLFNSNKFARSEALTEVWAPLSPILIIITVPISRASTF